MVVAQKYDSRPVRGSPFHLAEIHLTSTTAHMSLVTPAISCYMPPHCQADSNHFLLCLCTASLDQLLLLHTAELRHLYNFVFVFLCFCSYKSKKTLAISKGFIKDLTNFKRLYKRLYKFQKTLQI